MERNSEEFDFTPIDDGKDGCKIMDVTSRMRYSSAPMHSRLWEQLQSRSLMVLLRESELVRTDRDALGAMRTNGLSSRAHEQVVFQPATRSVAMQ